MDGSSSGHTFRRMPVLYRFIRSFFRIITGIWFREINLVDDEHIADESGVLFVTWHPNGLIDPMLMTARLQGRVSTLLHHRLFRIPLLRWLFQAAGMVPIGSASQRATALGLARSDEAILRDMAKQLAYGGQVLVFPEDTTHGEATVQRIRSGPARMLLQAHREAAANGRPLPRVVPVGLHYSASNRFRERAAIVLERAMEVPSMPPVGADASKPTEAELEWISTVTSSIEVELRRANLAKSTWRERTLIWKGRGLVQAEKQRQAGQALSRSSYAEAILGARRLRAGWEYMLREDPTVAEDLALACERHFTRLEALALRPHDVDAKPPTLTKKGYAKAVGSWLWAVVWMFGLVTWGAMIGNYIPYKFQGLVDSITRRVDANGSMQGTVKVLSSMVVFPLWWLGLSLLMAWLLLDNTSPVYLALASHQLLKYVTMLPAVGVFVFFMLFWPLTARAHLNLYARLVRSTRRLRQWRAWGDESNDWGALVQQQQQLAHRLVSLGSDLVLPGDEDWTDPPAGKDDAEMVRRRGESLPQ
jgi:1-acyl-sn-glycerol-3-phosphate acyltransferase